MKTLWLVLISLVLVGAVACGDDDEFDGNNISPNSVTNNTTNNGGADTGDVGVDSGGPDADAGPSGDTDTDPPAPDLCGTINDLGLLGANATNEASGDTANGVDLLTPSCGSQGRDEVTFAFQFDATARVEAEVRSQATDDWTLTLLEGPCESSSQVTCRGSRADVFTVDAGVTYLLSVEAPVAASFSLSLKATELSCAPVGSSTCESGQVTHCELGNNEAVYGCAYDCDGGACGGDTCAGPLVISGSGSHTFSGSYKGYKSRFNFSNFPDCSTSGAGASTPGPDLIFSLTGLSSGDTVTIDASNDDVQQGIFVLEGCTPSQPACVDGGLQLYEDLEWTVPDDGDYHVVVDALDQSEDDFDITITRP